MRSGRRSFNKSAEDAMAMLAQLKADGRRASSSRRVDGRRAGRAAADWVPWPPPNVWENPPPASRAFGCRHPPHEAATAAAE